MNAASQVLKPGGVQLFILDTVVWMSAKVSLLSHISKLVLPTYSTTVLPLQNLAMCPNSWQLKHVIGFPPITINQKQTFIVSVSFFLKHFCHSSSILIPLFIKLTYQFCIAYNESNSINIPHLPFTPFLPSFNIFKFTLSRVIILTTIYTITVRISPFSFSQV